MSTDSTIERTDDLRIAAIHEVTTPSDLQIELPITANAAATCAQARRDIQAILNGRDDRLLVIVGPCSIHDVDAAMDYCQRLSTLREELNGDLLIVMRVYFEKPRTTVGWKGLINDPDLDGSFNINKGLRMGRKVLLDINDSGMPAGVEFLDLISPQYIADLVSWGAIGARTTESQGHRELASGLSCPVGFKNGTGGDVKIAVDAIGAACRGHHFMSVTKEGHSAIVTTTGNADCHVILRGGKQPNYDPASVDDAAKKMEKADLQPRLMIDFSHANSAKQFERQKIVGADVAGQLAAGDKRIMGVMVESHINEGSQKVVEGQPLNYGQSITDACLGWADTEEVLRTLADGVAKRRSA